jgi:hypothetical protein
MNSQFQTGTQFQDSLPRRCLNSSSDPAATSLFLKTSDSALERTKACRKPGSLHTAMIFGYCQSIADDSGDAVVETLKTRTYARSHRRGFANRSLPIPTSQLCLSGYHGRLNLSTRLARSGASRNRAWFPSRCRRMSFLVYAVRGSACDPRMMNDVDCEKSFAVGSERRGPPSGKSYGLRGPSVCRGRSRLSFQTLRKNEAGKISRSRMVKVEREKL